MSSRYDFGRDAFFFQAFSEVNCSALAGLIPLKLFDLLHAITEEDHVPGITHPASYMSEGLRVLVATEMGTRTTPGSAKPFAEN